LGYRRRQSVHVAFASSLIFRQRLERFERLELFEPRRIL
jgi:hypothetical protein